MDGWGHRRIVVNPGAELARLREERGLSLRQLALRVHYSHATLWKIENGRTPLKRKVAEACDAALNTNGALIAALEAAARDTIRPAQLPAAPGRLVGRNTELDAMTDGAHGRLPGTPTVVVIDGPAGAGKTALALRWAHQVADQYADGQLYADLGGFGPPGRSMSTDEVLEEFLTAMGAPAIPKTPAGRAALYRTLVADRKVLIVLDNAADHGHVEALLPASADCAVVVTSRRALTGLAGELDATRITVIPLTEHDSIELLRHLLGEARADAEAESVATLARLCGHLPVALRAAAAQLTIYPHRSVTDLVDELLENDQQAGALGIAELRATMSWSYSVLSADEARLFRLMGLPTGAHTSVNAVAALARVTRIQARRLLHALAAVHLVEFDSDDVIRLPPLVRAYAWELAQNEELAIQRAAAAQRLVSWYAATLREASRHLTPHHSVSVDHPALTDGVEPMIFTDDMDAWSWCDSESENFGPITTMALQHGPRGVAHQLAAGIDLLSLAGSVDRPDKRESGSLGSASEGPRGQDPPTKRYDSHQSRLANGFPGPSGFNVQGSIVYRHGGRKDFIARGMGAPVRPTTKELADA
jgi:DNA-binding XRE family transcriptional regulator